MSVSSGNQDCELHTTQYTPVVGSEINLEVSKVDSIIFDLDGTLVNSAPQITDALNQTLDKFGDTPVTLDQVISLLGKPLNEILTMLNLGGLFREQFVTEFRRNLQMLIDSENTTFPFVAELLELIKHHGKKIGIATSKPTSLARSVVEKSLLNGRVNFVQGTDNSLYKPHPSVIQLCMSELGSKKALMVGDRREDLAAANAARIKSIGIAQSSHSKCDLLLEKPLFVVDSIHELLIIFDNQLKFPKMLQED